MLKSTTLKGTAAAIMGLFVPCMECSKDECPEWCAEFTKQSVMDDLKRYGDMRAGEPRYPDNTRAVANDTLGQMAKVHEELQEAMRALVTDEPVERVLEELCDTEHALEGVLRKFPAKDVATAREAVIAKNRKRGDYR